MRKMLLAVVLVGAACADKTRSSGPGQAIVTAAEPQAAPQAAAQAEPPAPAEPTKAEQKSDEPRRALAKPQRARKTASVARTAQPATAQRTTPQKLPATEAMRRDGPG